MKRLTSIGIVAVLVCFSSAYVYGRTPSDSPAPAEASEPSPKQANSSKDSKVKADVLRLVADAKAGKLKSPPPQFPARTKRNNLSTGAKIGIIAAIGGAIFLIIMFSKLNSDDD